MIKGKLESEKDTEKYLRTEMLRHGGMSFKWTSPGMKGVPDRICIFRNNKVIFVETKSEGDKPKPHQLRIHKSMREKGALVYVIDTKGQVNNFIKKHNTMPTF